MILRVSRPAQSIQTELWHLYSMCDFVCESNSSWSYIPKQIVSLKMFPKRCVPTWRPNGIRSLICISVMLRFKAHLSDLWYSSMRSMQFRVLWSTLLTKSDNVRHVVHDSLDLFWSLSGDNRYAGGVKTSTGDPVEIGDFQKIQNFENVSRFLKFSISTIFWIFW